MVTAKPRRPIRRLTQQQWWQSGDAQELYWSGADDWPDPVPLKDRDQEGREWELHPVATVRTLMFRGWAEEREDDDLADEDAVSFVNWWRWWLSRGRLLTRRRGVWPCPKGDADAVPPLRELHPPRGYYERRRRGRA